MNGPVFLVEGESDRAALAELLRRLDVNLDRVSEILVTGGATNFAKVLRRNPSAFGGMIDQAEVRHLARALLGIGLAGPFDPKGLSELGFQVCRADLEQELIRSLGQERVIDEIDRIGDRSSWERFIRQPAQRFRSDDQQLHRFFGTRSGRKIEYARLMARLLDLDALPLPLAGSVDRLISTAG